VSGLESGSLSTKCGETDPEASAPGADDGFGSGWMRVSYLSNCVHGSDCVNCTPSLEIRGPCSRTVVGGLIFNA